MAPRDEVKHPNRYGTPSALSRATVAAASGGVRTQRWWEAAREGGLSQAREICRTTSGATGTRSVCSTTYSTVSSGLQPSRRACSLRVRARACCSSRPLRACLLCVAARGGGGRRRVVSHIQSAWAYAVGATWCRGRANPASTISGSTRWPKNCKSAMKSGKVRTKPSKSPSIMTSWSCCAIDTALPT